MSNSPPTSRIVEAKPEHEVAYLELGELVGRHAREMTALEMLAVAANMVGKLVAMQDQSKVSPERVMETVARNVELGNRQVLDALLDEQRTAGSA